MANRNELEQALRAAHAAGDEAAARRLAEALASTPKEDTKPFGWKDAAIGAADIAISGVRGIVNEPSTTLAGLFGAVDPNDTFMAAKGRQRAAIEGDDLLVKSERLRTPQGELMAQIMGLNPQLKLLGDVLNAGGEGIERVAGPEARDVAESALTLGTLRTPGAAAERTAPAAEAINRMRQSGYVVPAHTPSGPGGATAGTRGENALAGMAGGEKVDALISVKNQDVSSRWLSRGANLGTEFVEPAAVKRAITQAELPYEEIRKAAITVRPDQTLLQDAAGIINEAGQISPTAVRAVRDLTQGLSPDSVIDSVRKLRQQGFNRLSSDNVEAQEIGELQIRAADALDGALERSLKREAAAAAQTGNVTLARTLDRLHGAYLEGRAWRADLHVLEDVMNPTTGAVSPQKLQRISQRRKLNPFYQRVVDAYNTSPYAMMDLAPASRTSQVGTMDVAMGGGVQSVKSVSGLGTLIGSLLGRTAARKAASSPTSKALAAMRKRNRRAVARVTAVGQSVDNQEQRQ